MSDERDTERERLAQWIERLRPAFPDIQQVADMLRADAGKDETIRKLREALHLIEIVDQGCGGNLTFKEMAYSAMQQAKDALAATTQPVKDGGKES